MRDLMKIKALCQEYLFHKMYEPQLTAYKHVWENLTGEPVSKSEIFFVMKRYA